LKGDERNSKSFYVPAINGSFHVILRGRQRREHSLYLCNNLIHAPRKKAQVQCNVEPGKAQIFICLLVEGHIGEHNSGYPMQIPISDANIPFSCMA